MKGLLNRIYGGDHQDTFGGEIFKAIIITFFVGMLGWITYQVAIHAGLFSTKINNPWLRWGIIVIGIIGVIWQGAYLVWFLVNFKTLKSGGKL